MKSVLVTGGAGYIGSHTCKALASEGYLPIVYDNLIHGHRWAVQWGPFEYGDVLDCARLDEVIAIHRPVAAIHFAGLAVVGESVAHPGRYYRNNATGSLNLIDALKVQNVKHIIFSSSCATYGVPTRNPIAEKTPQNPINPYGMSKLIVERMLADYGTANGPDWVSLRYFNAAGADSDCEIGEDHDPETRIIPLALAAADGQSGPLTIFGSDYDTPDGTCIRDYVHVSDLASAHVTALKALEGGLASQPLNLGTGKGYSVLEVVNAASEVSGMKVPFVMGPRRDGDPAALVADPSKARRILQWEPTYTSLTSIVDTAWQWHLSKKRRRL